MDKDHDLIADIYQTIENPDLWSDVLGRIARAVGGDKGIIYTDGICKKDGGLWILQNIDKSAIDRYLSHYSQLDIWRAVAAQKSLHDGRINLGQAVVPQDQFRRTEFYADFARPLEIENLISFVTPVSLQGLSPLIHFSIFSDRRSKPFDQTSIKHLDIYKGHIQKSLSLGASIAEHTHSVTAQALVRAIGEPAILVNREFRVLSTNFGGEQMLHNQTHLSSKMGALTRTKTSNSLFELLYRVFSQPSAAGPQMTATKCPDRTLCIYKVIPVGIGSEKSEQVNYAIIIARLHNRKRAIDWNLFAIVFQLTRTEILVTKALVEGKSLEEISDHMGITRETARTHLKRIFHKTDCHRQSDLIRLALNNFSDS